MRKIQKLIGKIPTDEQIFCNPKNEALTTALQTTLETHLEPSVLQTNVDSSFNLQYRDKINLFMHIRGYNSGELSISTIVGNSENGSISAFHTTSVVLARRLASY